MWLDKELREEVMKFDKQLIRDIKLRMALGELPELPKPNIELLRKHKFFDSKLNTIEHWKDAGIITGSISLIAHGLLNRSPNDIDIIRTGDQIQMLFTKTPYGTKRTIIYKNREYECYLNRYPGMEENIVYYIQEDQKRYSLTKFTSTLINIDFFDYNDQTYTEVDGFKFHNPFEVLSMKTHLMENDKNRFRGYDLSDLYESAKKYLDN